MYTPQCWGIFGKHSGTTITLSTHVSRDTDMRHSLPLCYNIYILIQYFSLLSRLCTSHNDFKLPGHAGRGGLKAAMIEALRQAKPSRGRRRTTLAGSSMVPETLRIIHRPEEIGARLVPGHWEGDLLKGAFNRSSVGTLVERKTRFVVLCKMDGNTAEAALEGFTKQMKRLPAALRKSMTYDRGSELACHPELARRLKIDIWFADPHAPWQRSSNENTNGLLRQFMPKGTDLSDASQTWLNDVARLMNGRPRKTLGWKTPAETMAEEIAASRSNVALAS